MIAILQEYDWEQCFVYAPNVREAYPGQQISKQPFGATDVAEIYWMDAGENDGADWLIAGRLHDGRYFAHRAGCDYTGWDCQAGGHSRVAATRTEMFWYCLEAEERDRFKIGAPRSSWGSGDWSWEDPAFDHVFKPIHKDEKVCDSDS